MANTDQLLEQLTTLVATINGRLGGTSIRQVPAFEYTSDVKAKKIHFADFPPDAHHVRVTAKDKATDQVYADNARIDLSGEVALINVHLDRDEITNVDFYDFDGQLLARGKPKP